MVVGRQGIAAELLAGVAMTALTFLSLRRSLPFVRRQQPHVPSNEDRVRAYRAATPPLPGNAYPWPHRLREAYARDAAADAEPIEIQRGYAALSEGE